MSCLAAMSRWLKFRQVILLLLLIMAVGSLLRIYDLATESICLDEAVGINFSAYHGVGSIIEEAAVTQNHPPFYFILLHFWTNHCLEAKSKSEAQDCLSIL